MRILQVAPPWFEVPPRAYGGIELVIGALADGLVAAGHDVTLLASGGSRTAAHLHTVYPAPPSLDLGDTMTELMHVMAVDDLHGFDVVHDHTLLGTAWSVAHGTWPLVHTLHGPWSERSVQVYRRLASGAALAAISHDQAARAPSVPIAAVVYNGIDVDRFPIGLDRTDELVFVGRASPEKGPEQTIEVARRTGRPLAMAIKVNEPTEHDYWQQVLKPLLCGIDARVTLDATHEEKTAMMARAHAVVLPIQWDEPFGLVMAEAAACGAPVVVYGRGAAPEVVQDGVTGFVIDPDAGIEALCEAVEVADTIDAATCREHVLAHFSSQRMVAGYLELYEELRRPRFMRARSTAFTSASIPIHDTPGKEQRSSPGRSAQNCWATTTPATSTSVAPT
jgi:glycosyltransferase involved in cell wall biosynthesis